MTAWRKENWRTRERQVRDGMHVPWFHLCSFSLQFCGKMILKCDHNWVLRCRECILLDGHNTLLEVHWISQSPVTTSKKQLQFERDQQREWEHVYVRESQRDTVRERERVRGSRLHVSGDEVAVRSWGYIRGHNCDKELQPTYLPWRTWMFSLSEVGHKSSSMTRTPRRSASMMGTTLHSLLSWFPVRYELWPV